MLEPIHQISATEISSWEGTALESLLSDPATGTLKAFQTEKLAKVTLGGFRVNGSLHYGLCTIFPREGYDLPVFISTW